MLIPFTYRIDGVEAIAHWKLYSSDGVWHTLCAGGCGVWGVDTIAPVEVLDGGEVDPSSDEGSSLCEPCSTRRLPGIAAWRRVGWPDLSRQAVEALWVRVWTEKLVEIDAMVARARRARLAGAFPNLEAIKASLRAAQEAAGHQGVDRVGKVA